MPNGLQYAYLSMFFLFFLRQQMCVGVNIKYEGLLLYSIGVALCNVQQLLFSEIMQTM